MMKRSAIPWADYSAGDLNFVTGCTPVSEGCANCYAKAIYERHHWDFAHVQTHPEKLERLRRWHIPGKRAVSGVSDAVQTYVRGWGSHPLAFVCDTGDLFHEDVPDEFILAAFGVMAARSDVTWQILTKRPERAHSLLTSSGIAQRVDLFKHIVLAGRLGEFFAAESIKPVGGWPGYFVTNKGRIISDRTNAGVRSLSDQHEMLPQYGDKGHARVMLQVNGTTDRLLVHRLVLAAFDRSARHDEQACHIDGNPMNNALWNLRWGSQSDNWADSKRHGTARRHSKLSPKDVADIRRRAQLGERVQAIATEYDLSDTQARNIIQGKQWRPETQPEWPLASVWFGVTAENQRRVDERIPILLQIPAVVRFVSVEPMLEPVDLVPWLYADPRHGRFGCSRIDAAGQPQPSTRYFMPPRVDWVICGAESGPHRRPFQVAWAEALYWQCQAAGVPFFSKQDSGPRPGVPLPINGKEIREFPEVGR